MNAFLASVEISIQAGCLSYAALRPPLTVMNILPRSASPHPHPHHHHVIVGLRNVSSILLDTNPEICGPGIGGDLAITNYGLFLPSYHWIRLPYWNRVYPEYLNRWHNWPAYVSSIFSSLSRATSSNNYSDHLLTFLGDCTDA